MILLKIIKGEYPPGSRLQGVRELAITAGVNPNTMQRALAELEEKGILFVKRGDGRYVSEETERINQLKNRYVMQKAQDYVSSLEELNLDPAAITKAVETILKERKGELS
jgi:DNA-binding transcriptional regulator YhcF (GntR family)